MSSFFTLPASQKKRKRPQRSTKPASAGRRNASREDDSISGSDASDDDRVVAAEPGNALEDDDEEEVVDEDPASKRIRLAEQYLANTQKEVLEVGGFDAAEIDKENLRRRMGERLKEDTAESKGKLYRWIASDLDWGRANKVTVRGHNFSKTVTGIAIHGRHIYAVSKDLQLVKYEFPNTAPATEGRRMKKRLKVARSTRGNKKTKDEQHHHEPILCIAASHDGQFLATGGADKKLIIWDAASMKALKVFTQHRDSVTALAFRRGTNQLFSASKDRTVKIWSLDELAYVETLFGHQDEVVGVSALAQERCITVGARDRTARLWKVVEESQLVFRGGGAPGTAKALQALKQAYGEDSTNDVRDERGYHEGSTDWVAMIDDDTFVTASDNGSLSLWNIYKKKAVFTLPLAHGLDPALSLEQASAEQDPDETLDERGRGGKQPRWVTALTAIPFSDVVVTGSWDGYIRGWKISQDKKRIEPLGVVGGIRESLDKLLENEGLNSESLSNEALGAMRAGLAAQGPINGVVNDISIVDQGERGRDGALIAVAVGKEHRFGRWKEVSKGRNCVVLFEVPKKTNDSNFDAESAVDVQDGDPKDAAEFAGFD